MKTPFLLLSIIISVAFFIGCGEKSATETAAKPASGDPKAELKAALDAFETDASETTAAAVDKAMEAYAAAIEKMKAEMDGLEGNELANHQRTIQEMEKHRSESKVRYMELRVKAGLDKAKEEVEAAVESVQHGAEAAADHVQEATEAAAHSAADAADKVGEKLEEAADATKTVVEDAAEKVQEAAEGAADKVKEAVGY